jgi:hypothetical protein
LRIKKCSWQKQRGWFAEWIRQIGLFVFILYAPDICLPADLSGEAAQSEGGSFQSQGETPNIFIFLIYSGYIRVFSS